jgi:hypothetical protein
MLPTESGSNTANLPASSPLAWLNRLSIFAVRPASPRDNLPSQRERNAAGRLPITPNTIRWKRPS